MATPRGGKKLKRELPSRKTARPHGYSSRRISRIPLISSECELGDMPAEECEMEPRSPNMRRPRAESESLRRAKSFTGGGKDYLAPRAVKIDRIDEGY